MVDWVAVATPVMATLISQLAAAMALALGMRAFLSSAATFHCCSCYCSTVQLLKEATGSQRLRSLMTPLMKPLSNSAM